ncbi:SH3 domain-containing protein [Lederbergia wuyishanensis]|uniref:Uncharacterized protein n=1 Tax=Lederbergia wuyishanensis TaxID=1347903 RepID=A0ABU0D3P5_9BACI|nr:SH3 domain-containing protein [Lederbergia wuyishanensis]MCJ8007809.1 hypothetical protein [Lederbergia wuyishanensis]MDQ0343026.1 hypothetical protein [Lederbergia wuyishanensis]
MDEIIAGYVEKPPIILESFENGLEHWICGGARFKSISIRQTKYPEPARFGKSSLELKYDFAGTTGISGAYAYTKEKIILHDYPKAIGMWVYGDGNNHLLRAQLRDGKGHPFQIDLAGKVDWIGWKYVECKIPHGKSTPLTLDIPVRLLETNDNNKNAGKIYVDNIRSVYGKTNEDLINPEIFGECPSANEVVSTSTVKIGAFAKDEESGINPTRIRMYLDGNELTPTYIEEENEIFYTPSEPLLDGYHQVKLVVQDYYGNETERIWQFIVEAGGPGIKPIFEKATYIGNPLHVFFEANEFHKFKRIELHIKFDPCKLKHLEKQIILHPIIPPSCIVRNEVTEEGYIYIELKGLDQLETSRAIQELLKLTFLMHSNIIEPTKINLIKGMATLKGERQTPIYFPPIEIVPKAHYKIAIDRASLGFNSTLIVTDEKGHGIHGATIQVIFPEYKLALLNSELAFLYKDPSDKSEVMFKLKKDTELVVLEIENDWLKVVYRNKIGWLKAESPKLFPWKLGKTDCKGNLKTDRLSLIEGELLVQAHKGKQYSFYNKDKSSRTSWLTNSRIHQYYIQ